MKDMKKTIFKLILSLVLVAGFGNLATGQSCSSVLCTASSWPCPLYIIDNTIGCTVPGITASPENCAFCGTDTTSFYSSWGGNCPGDWCGCPPIPGPACFTAVPPIPGFSVIGDCCDCVRYLSWNYLGIHYTMDLTASGYSPSPPTDIGDFYCSACGGVAHIEFSGTYVQPGSLCATNFIPSGLATAYPVNLFTIKCGP
jgi:hypothetical protein